MMITLTWTHRHLCLNN